MTRIAWNKGKSMVHSGSFKKGHKGYISNLGMKLSEETKEKMSKSLRGRVAWNKGKKNPYSVETLKKMLKGRTGKPAWNKGIKGTHFSPATEFKPGHTLIKKQIRIKTTSGYIHIYSPDHPYRQKKFGRIFEHRLIVEEQINRYLIPTEKVHHLNEVKHDNRPENLMAFTSESAHQRFHASPDKVKSEEIIFDGRTMDTYKNCSIPL